MEREFDFFSIWKDPFRDSLIQFCFIISTRLQLITLEELLIRCVGLKKKDGCFNSFIHSINQSLIPFPLPDGSTSWWHCQVQYWLRSTPIKQMKTWFLCDGSPALFCFSQIQVTGSTITCYAQVIILSTFPKCHVSLPCMLNSQNEGCACTCPKCPKGGPVVDAPPSPETTDRNTLWPELSLCYLMLHLLRKIKNKKECTGTSAPLKARVTV